MRTVFLSFLPLNTNNQKAVRDWIVATSGITPEDVMCVCKRGATSTQALARFSSEGEAFEAIKLLDKGKVRAHLAHKELRPPTDQRWGGLWMNFEPKY
jgi:hypothetical protein